ncbi:MAG: hypothetical protein WC773_03340 [Patescibacteria group bacterium]
MLITLSIFLLFIAVVTLAGQRVWRLVFNLPESKLFVVASSYLIGLTIFVLLLEFLGILRWFNGWTVSIAAVAMFLVALGEIKQLRKRRIDRRNILAEIKKQKWLLIPLIILAGVNILACFAPATAWDEVAYHLPEANYIVHQSGFVLPLGGSKFYGNLPISMETLFAFGMMVKGVSLMHLLHFSYFLAMMVAIIGFLHKRYSLNTGLIAAILIFFVPQLIENATSGYIDAGEAVMEVMAILSMTAWLESKSERYIWLSGFFFGAAAGIKYSAFYGILTTVVVVAIFLTVRRQWSAKFLKTMLYFTGIAALVGGFWYVKNWIVFHNPTYPLILVHPGYTDNEINTLNAAIKNFSVPRTLTNFLRIPEIFWQNTAGYYNLFIFSSFFAPFALLNPKNRRTTLLLSSLVVVDIVAWFFVISHQQRFLFPALVVLSILSAITLSNLKPIAYKVGGVILIAVVIINSLNPFVPTRRILNSLFYDTFKVEEAAYATGRIGESAYLRYKLGDFALVTDYINHHYQGVVTLNIWNHTAQYYLENGNSYTYAVPSDSDYAGFISQNKIKLLAVDVRLRQKFIDLKNWGAYTDNGIALEQYFISHATLIVNNPNSQLYEIKP